MLRGPSHWVLGVRRPDDTVSVEEFPLKTLLKKGSIFRLPLIRGVVILIESMVLGIKSLMLSTQSAAGEEEKLSWKEIAVSLIMALAVFSIVFKLLPALFAVQLYNSVESALLINFLEGVVKIGLFVGYIWAISRVPDIARVFQYHGAEHQVIHSYEAGEKLGPDTASQHSTIHHRCGTSFMLLVFFLSVIVFTFLGKPPFIQRFLLHLAIIPVVAGISYEIIKLSAKNTGSSILKAIIWPGLLLQRLTTKTPDDKQIEVAVAALERLMVIEGLAKTAAVIDPPPSAVGAQTPA